MRLLSSTPRSKLHLRAIGSEKYGSQGQALHKDIGIGPKIRSRPSRQCLPMTAKVPFCARETWGFIHAGQLFVTGRQKDLIIIRGRNHYPQDIERTVERSHEALRAGGGAAFAVEVGNEERLVVVQEIERQYIRRLDAEAVIGAIRQSVSREHEIQAYAVVLLKTSSLPKTTSGKVQRHLCREHFIQGSLKVVAECVGYPQEVEPETPLQAWEGCRPGLMRADTSAASRLNACTLKAGELESDDMGTEDASDHHACH